MASAIYEFWACNKCGQEYKVASDAKPFTCGFCGGTVSPPGSGSVAATPSPVVPAGPTAAFTAAQAAVSADTAKLNADSAALAQAAATSAV